MRIALIAPPFESVPPLLYGGTERVVAHLAQGLADQEGVSVTVFASGDSQVPKNVHLHPICPKSLRLAEMLGDLAIPIHFQTWAAVAKQIKSGAFDIIHNHHDFWMLPLSELSELPFFTTLHGRLDLVGLEETLGSFPTSHFISISESQRGQAPSLRWARTIPHGIPIRDYPFTERPGKYLAFLGRISEEKRPEWAIQIAKKAGIPLKIAAKIEGRTGQSYFDERIRPHLSPGVVEYVGEISDREKGEFLGNALGLVFPIDWPEPFGLVMIESLACGTPVLARPMGSVPEVIEHGLTGFLSRDLSTLSHYALRLESLDRRFCRQQAVQRFSIRRMSEEYLNLYRHHHVSFLNKERGMPHGNGPGNGNGNGNGDGNGFYQDRRDQHYSLERTDQRSAQAHREGQL